MPKSRGWVVTARSNYTSLLLIQFWTGSGWVLVRSRAKLFRTKEAAEAQAVGVSVTSDLGGWNVGVEEAEDVKQVWPNLEVRGLE